MKTGDDKLRDVAEAWGRLKGGQTDFFFCGFAKPNYTFVTEGTGRGGRRTDGAALAKWN
jgi:hypothetical protein